MLLLFFLLEVRSSTCQSETLEAQIHDLPRPQGRPSEVQAGRSEKTRPDHTRPYHVVPYRRRKIFRMDYRDPLCIPDGDARAMRYTESIKNSFRLRYDATPPPCHQPRRAATTVRLEVRGVAADAVHGQEALLLLSFLLLLLILILMLLSLSSL